MIRAFNKEVAQVSIPGFCDAQLWITAARLVTAWSQSDIAADVTTLLEPVLVSYCEDEGNGGQCANPGYLDKSPCFREGLLRHLRNAFIVDFNLTRDLLNLINEWFQRRLESFR